MQNLKTCSLVWRLVYISFCGSEDLHMVLVVQKLYIKVLL